MGKFGSIIDLLIDSTKTMRGCPFLVLVLATLIMGSGSDGARVRRCKEAVGIGETAYTDTVDTLIGSPGERGTTVQEATIGPIRDGGFFETGFGRPGSGEFIAYACAPDTVQAQKGIVSYVCSKTVDEVTDNGITTTINFHVNPITCEVRPNRRTGVAFSRTGTIIGGKKLNTGV